MKNIIKKVLTSAIVMIIAASNCSFAAAGFGGQENFHCLPPTRREAFLNRIAPVEPFPARQHFARTFNMMLFVFIIHES